MKRIILFLSIVALVQSCSYWTDQGSYTLDDGWKNATDEAGNVWWFTLCPLSLEDEISDECSYPSLVCYTDSNGVTHSMGDYNKWSISNVIGLSNQGVELIYSANEQKTAIDVYCSWDGETISIAKPDETLTVITVNTSSVCKETELIYPYMPETGSFHEHVLFFPLSWICIVIGCLAVCMCCCCCAKRRRCRQNKDVAKQFSSVAFQPIPLHSNNAPSGSSASHQIPLPSYYNPYLNNTQFMFYPTQNSSNFQPVQLEEISVPNGENNVEMNDLQLAKQLQAQFDREASQV